MNVCDTTSETPIRRVIRNSHSLLKLQGKLYQITLKIVYKILDKHAWHAKQVTGNSEGLA